MGYGSSTFAVEGGILYSKGMTTLVACPYELITESFVVDARVTSIGNDAFHNAENMSSITFEGTITDIGESTFFMNNFTSFEFPNGIKTIKRNVLGRSNRLEYIVIPTSVTKIERYIAGNINRSQVKAFYEGTAENFAKVEVDSIQCSGFGPIYCYNEVDPATISEESSSGEPAPTIYYWHYVDDVRTPW